MGDLFVSPHTGSDTEVNSSNNFEDPSPPNQPTESSMSYQPSSGSTVGLNSDGAIGKLALKDLLNKDYVVDCLAENLDRVYKSKNNHGRLAEEIEAPQEIKDKCNCHTVHSPTLTLLDRPDIQSKNIKELMDAIKKANRIDVLTILQEKVPEEDRGKSIEDGLSRNPELMDEIATKLDRQRSSRVTKNWRVIGKFLGIDEDELDLIEKGGKNPAEELLLYAYSSLPPEKMQAKEFRRIIMEFTKRKDLHKLLDTLGITENNDRPLKNIIPPNSNDMKKMTAALNKCSPGLQNWRNLASRWGCKSDHFDYPAESSPTKTLLEWVRDSMDHKVTVHEFLKILGEKIKRYDVKQELEEVIEEKKKDILATLSHDGVNELID